MTENASTRLTAVKGRIGAMAKAAPSLMQGFSAVSKAATAEGAFSAAEKELLATAIAVTTGCDDCILYHVESAKSHGATEEALVEALTVAVEMGGGPALMYAGKALDAFRAF